MGQANHLECEHAHEEHRGEPLIDAARDALVSSGEQWTELRADVFTALAGLDRPVSAYDIADALTAKRGKRVAPNTVYRILDLFVTRNLALRIESANAFIANSHPGCLHDCIFLVCNSCGGTTHVDEDTITQSVRSVAAARDFSASRPIIEVRGTCASCN